MLAQKLELQGLVETTYVWPFASPDPTVPLMLYTCLAVGKVTVLLNVRTMSLAPPVPCVALTGPATTAPLASTIETLVKRQLDVQPLDVVATSKIIVCTETASPRKLVAKPPIG